MKIDSKDYKNIVNNLHEGILILDFNFKITFTNNFFSDLIDHPLNKIVGDSFLDLLDLKDVNLLKSHLKNNIDKNLDLKILSKKEKIKYVRLSFKEYKNEAKKLILAIV